MQVTAIAKNAGMLAATEANPTTKNGNQTVNGETFLKLLVEQLKHQDPLAPQDGTQFVAQLAQFNSLEQLISINERLGQLVTTK
jgi:flagellar basal-body rod modification protein FlgD